MLDRKKEWPVEAEHDGLGRVLQQRCPRRHPHGRGGGGLSPLLIQSDERFVEDFIDGEIALRATWSHSGEVRAARRLVGELSSGPAISSAREEAGESVAPSGISASRGGTN